MSDKGFKIFLVVSFVVHGVLFAKLPSFNFPSFKAPFQKIEITYRNVTPLLKDDKVKTKKIELLKPKTQKKRNFLKTALKTPPQFKDIRRTFKTPKELLKRPRLIEHAPGISGIKKVTLPEIKDSLSLKEMANLPKNPIYLKYYQSIREKIRRYAYYNYNRAHTGEVYLSFIVSSKGSLIALKIIDQKSTPNDYLKEIAVRSIKDSAPFARIPDELDFPELSFNVIIAFELD